MRTAISLGNLCAPARYGVVHGLRTTKENGYKTCPFDLMISNIDGMLDCISTNFVQFLNVRHLETRWKRNNTRFRIVHKYYNFIFNHESFDPLPEPHYLSENWPLGPEHFIKDNYARWFHRYKQRVENFRHYCTTADHITFIVMNNNISVESRIERVISSVYPELDFDVLRIPNGPIHKH